MSLEFKTCSEAFFSSHYNINQHMMITKTGSSYSLHSKADLNKCGKHTSKISMAEILHTLLKKIEQPNVTTNELQIASSISQYYINKKTPQTILGKIQEIFNSIYNFVKGFGFQSSLSIAKKIQTQISKMSKIKFTDLETPNIAALTYSFTGGRFGDNMLAYLKGKFASIKYSAPLVYKQFEFSDRFVLDSLECNINNVPKTKFLKQITYLKEGDLKDFKNGNPLNGTLYTLPYDNFHESDWNDPAFKKAIEPLLKLKSTLPLMDFPKDKIPVAIHVRRGGGFDSAWDMKQMPTKFPPDSYYLETLRKVSACYNGKPLYVYLFTDDKNPQVIVDSYKKQLQDLNLTFDFRKENNAHNANIIEDWHAMTQFEVLIRPDSSLSYTAAIAGNHKVIVRPQNWNQTRLENESIVVDFAIEDRRNEVDT